MRKVLWAIIIMAVAVIAAAAQTERSDEKAFNAAVDAAKAASSDRTYRKTVIEKFFTGQAVNFERKITVERKPSGEKAAETFMGSRKTSVEAEGAVFCHDGTKWVRSETKCPEGDHRMAAPDGEFEYSTEMTAAGRAYIRTAVFPDSGGTRAAIRMRSYQERLVIGAAGEIIERSETRRGGSDENGWSSVSVTTYEYEPAVLHIKDPTKDN